METEQLVCTNFSVSNSFICVVSQINVIFAQKIQHGIVRGQLLENSNLSQGEG